MNKKISKLKESTNVIFGARLVGKALLRECTKQGIPVACLCDDNINRTGGTVDGIPVIPSPKAFELYPDATVIISAADIRDVSKRVIDLGWKSWESAQMLEEFDVDSYEWDNANPDFVKYTIDTCLLCQSNYLDEDKIFMRSIDIVVTERCSMKCKECSNLMQYYKNPYTYTVDEMTNSIDIFLNVVDEVNEARVIGGEPLVNKNCSKIVKRLNDSNKVKKTLVYTNATICPKEEQMLDYQSEKTIFYITDYGPKLSKNKDNMIEMLKKFNITYYINPAQGWTKCSTLDKKNRTYKENKVIFEACCSKNTTTLLNGVLYRCPFSANATKLKAIPNFKADYLNLNELGVEETRKKMKKWLFGKAFIGACEYCNGRSFDDPEIVPAEQISTPLEYKKY